MMTKKNLDKAFSELINIKMMMNQTFKEMKNFLKVTCPIQSLRH